MKNLPEKEKFELVVINPGFIIGPNLNKAQFVSGDSIKKFMMGDVPMIPDISVPMIDVRDCARAHLQAILVPEAAGKRFILANETHSLYRLCAILHSEFSRLGYSIPTIAMPYWIMWLGSWFVEDAAQAI